VGERRRIDDQERHPVGGRPLHALDQLVLDIALEAGDLVRGPPPGRFTRQGRAWE